VIPDSATRTGQGMVYLDPDRPDGFIPTDTRQR